MATDEHLACCRNETCCGMVGCNSIHRGERCCGMDFVYINEHREPKLVELMVIPPFLHYTRDRNKEALEAERRKELVKPKVTLQAYKAAIEARDQLDREKEEEEERDLDDFLKMEF